MNGSEFNSLRRCVILNAFLRELSLSLRWGLVPLSTRKPKTLYLGVCYDDSHGVRNESMGSTQYPVILEHINMLNGVFDPEDVTIVLILFDNGDCRIGVMISNSETNDTMTFSVKEGKYQFEFLP